MLCPVCQTDNPPSAVTCGKCSTPFPLSEVTLAPTDAGVGQAAGGQSAGWSVPLTRTESSEKAAKEQLEPGTVIGDRYEIQQLLGQGGMGAVYKARDVELERLVALKLIRPDLATHPEILRRFKQELILAREVTHRNVIRIFDLGQARGVRFITMEYVEGRDLRALLQEKGKLTPEQGVPIFVQIAAALEAAHHAGVVHRDLKPQNVMVDQGGRVYVMDFGVARSLETPGMTQTGALMGTPEYMSPEQAKGMKVDARSDLFSLGIIFYETLSGVSPFKADTAMATMFKRTKERAVPLSQVNKEIPAFLSDIVSKCLDIDIQQRYQSAREIIEDLEKWKSGVVKSAMNPVARWLKYAPPQQKWLAAGMAACLVIAAAYPLRDKLPLHISSNSAAAIQPISLAIAPFHNATTDLSIDWLGPSLAEMLGTGVGQSNQLRTVSSDRIHQILKDLRIPPNAELDSDTLRRLAEFSSADILVWGQYAKYGDQIRINATLQDLKHNRLVPLKIDAASEKEIPAAVDKLAELIWKNLAVSSDVLKELKASSFQPTSQSVPALRDYNQGLQLLRDGKNLDAVKMFQAATQEDAQFALAYSRLAESESALGYDNDAERDSRKALELSQQLPMAEKYLIEAGHARVMKDNKKAIEAYENLAKTAPGNNDIQSALAYLYLDMGDLEKARVHYSNVLKTEPKNLDALTQTGWVEVRSGRPQSGLDPLNRALSLAVEVDNQEQKAQVLEGLGTAYQAMNKPEEALHNFEQARDINLRLGKKAALANSLDWIANVQGSLGKRDLALANYKEALKIQQGIGAKRDAADTLISMGALFGYGGQLDKALQLFQQSLQIQRDVGNESNQALCLNNIGGVYENQGKNDDALTYYQQSLQLREKLGAPADIAESLGNVAEVYAKTAQFDQAMSSYMRALDIRRKAADNHGAAMVSDGIGVVFLYQGRFGAAVNSLQEAVKGLRDAQDRSENMVQTLNDFAQALASAGRGAEAAKILEEAQSLAAVLKNDERMSGVLNTRGDVLLHGGDFKAAKNFYQQALQSASRAKAQESILVAKLNLAEVAIAEGRSPSATGDLRSVVQQADGLDFKYLSLEGSVELAEALIKSKNYSQSLQELQTALSRSEKLGTRFLTLRINYLLGNALRLSGNSAQAAGHYGKAHQLLDDMKKEPGAEHLLDRSDLKSIYAEATH